MKIEIEKPYIIVLNYKQEKSDEDYGSCLWARFYFDNKNYTLSIVSDCGNYMYGWVSTPDTESFLHLMSRISKDYLLSKISSETQVNGDATSEAVKEYLNEVLDEEEPDFDYEDIDNICYYSSVDEVYNAILDCVRNTNAYNDFFKEYSIWECIVTDYPYQAKKIASIFIEKVQPYIKKYLLNAEEGNK